MRWMKFVGMLSVLIGICATGTGCSKSNGKTPGVYPVRGSVMVDGAPAEYANVILVPTESDSELSRAYGVVDSDGEFQLSTVSANDGAKPGEYFVTISWAKPINPKASEPDFGPELLPKKYQVPASSGLKVVIEPKDNELEPFELSKK